MRMHGDTHKKTSRGQNEEVLNESEMTDMDREEREKVKARTSGGDEEEWSELNSNYSE